VLQKDPVVPHLTAGAIAFIASPSDGMLRGLDLRIAQETKLPVHLVDAPLECVVLGAGRCVEIFDQVEDMFMQRPRG